MIVFGRVWDSVAVDMAISGLTFRWFDVASTIHHNKFIVDYKHHGKSLMFPVMSDSSENSPSSTTLFL